MSIWSTLGKIGLGIGGVAAAPFTGGASLLPTILGAAGAGLGAISSAKASNRGEKFGGQLGLEQLLMQRDQQFQNQSIAREQEGRTGASDAWKKLLSASHALSPGSRPHLSPYSVPSRGITGEEARGAGSLIDSSLGRLEGGNPIAPVTQRPLSVDPSLLDPGMLEKILGYAAPGLTTWSSLLKKQQPGTAQSQIQV